MATRMAKLRVRKGYVYYHCTEQGVRTNKRYVAGQELELDMGSNTYKGQKWKFDILNKDEVLPPEEATEETTEEEVTEETTEEESEEASTKSAAPKKESKLNINLKGKKDKKGQEVTEFPDSSKGFDFDGADDGFLEAWTLILGINLGEAATRESMIEKIKEAV